MSKLTWGQSKLYESGLDRGVLYLNDDVVVPWNGLVSIARNEIEDSTVSTTYFDGLRRRVYGSTDNFSAQIEAYTYPNVFEEYEGLFDINANQSRKNFGFSYRNNIGNSGYQIHLIYNATVAPPSKTRNAIDSGNTIDPFSWDITTTPETMEWATPSSHLVIDTTSVRYPRALKDLEDLLYGTDTTDPRLPLPNEVIEIFEQYVVLRISLDGDGTWTATGPDSMVPPETPDGEITLISPSAFWIDDDSWLVSSY